MRKLVVDGVLTMLIAMMPFAVMAQAGSLDPEARATVEALAKQVGSLVVPGITAPDGVAESLETPEPEETPEPTDEPVTLPELDLTDLAEYTNEGITIQAPADWIVDTDIEAGIADESIFFIEVPDTELFVVLSTDANLDFPSMLAVALFRSQGELLMTQFGDGTQIDESATVLSAQGLPMAKLAFSGEDAGEQIGGVFYVVAPNETAYLFVAGGPADEWAYALPGVELIAESITFDGDLITLTPPEVEPFIYTDNDETLEVEVPVGWYAVSTGDSVFPIVLTEPDARYVVAIGADEAFGADYDASVLEEFIPAEGEIDAELADELLTTVLDMLDSSGTALIVDEEQSQVISREGAVTVRLVGEADLGDDLTLPVIFYADLRPTGAVAIAVFGDIESALTVEADIQALTESVTRLE